MTVEFEDVAVQLGRVFRVISGRVADAAYIMIGAPIGHQARIALGHQFRTDRMERHACRFGFRADVVPECRIVQRRAGAVFFYVGLVECRRPATGLRAVQRRFVEKGRSDRLSEIFGHPFVVSLVRHRNVGFGRLFAQIIHVRIVVRDADELHDFPVPFGYFPDDGFLGDVA